MLAAAEGSTYAAAVGISLQDTLTKTPEITGVLLSECVAGRAVAVGADLLSPTPAAKGSLRIPVHESTLCSRSLLLLYFL